MAGLLFGTGGIPLSTQERTTPAGIERIAALGLGCMEVEFVQGVKMSPASAEVVARTAQAAGVALSAHAPYFINFNAREPEKIRASQQRLIQTVRVAAICGARSIVFHPAFYMDDPPERAYQNVKTHLEETLDELGEERQKVSIRLEIMGRPTQFGTIEEVLALCAELEGLSICVDFAHWHARTGRFNTYPEFVSVLKQIEGGLGRAALGDMHMHISGIAYQGRGEIKHLNLADSDLNYTELMRALKDCEAKGLVVCESPNLEDDARLLQKTYNEL